MATVTSTKLRVNIKLNAGNNKTVSVSLGTLDNANFDADKVSNIVMLLSSIFDNDYSISSVEKVETSVITQ